MSQSARSDTRYPCASPMACLVEEPGWLQDLLVLRRRLDNLFVPEGGQRSVLLLGRQVFFAVDRF